MEDPSLTFTYSVPAPPPRVFAAITEPRSWWMSHIDGAATAVGDEFGYAVPDAHRVRLRVEDLVPGRRVAWRVTDNWMAFVQDQREWIDTLIRFDLTPRHDGTEVRFTHEGLRRQDECYEVCSDAWSRYAHRSLRQCIVTGVGAPDSATSAVDRERS